MLVSKLFIRKQQIVPERSHRNFGQHHEDFKAKEAVG
jgi:hypothetical protein